MVRIFKWPESNRSVRYISYIGDAKYFLSIAASSPYKEGTQVTKLECVVRIQKRIVALLQKLKQTNSKFSDGDSVGRKSRVIDKMIDLIVLWNCSRAKYSTPYKYAKS
ncbi:hypothetical protein NPIL_220791 [Nephila pilipes]|uniref:Uncharacterized protein n=1 Tax=Nephila pilipes TaxID=299642 RepID=A0A8X6NJ98_NEPPI|nr:hypothetical protein NPIL_220791 [Nephila pilipes]